jgi:hypothetical protein
VRSNRLRRRGRGPRMFDGLQSVFATFAPEEIETSAQVLAYPE